MATSGFTISLEKFEKLQKKFRKLPAQLRSDIFTDAFRQSSRELLREVKARVPVDTGALKEGIRVRVLKKKVDERLFTIHTPTPQELGIDPGSFFYYPAHIELGTRHVAPNPYLRDSLVSRTPKIIFIFKGILRLFLRRR